MCVMLCLLKPFIIIENFPHIWIIIFNTSVCVCVWSDFPYWIFFYTYGSSDFFHQYSLQSLFSINIFILIALMISFSMCSSTKKSCCQTITICSNKCIIFILCPKTTSTTCTPTLPHQAALHHITTLYKWVSVCLAPSCFILKCLKKHHT